MLKKLVMLTFFAATLCGGAPTSDAAANREKVAQFIKNAKCYFIATVENDQPRVRPFGTILVFDNKLYIQTGKKKKVFQQIVANPKVELCAFNGKEWLRLSGKLVLDERREVKVAMLDAYPSLKSMYSPDDDNTVVLYFQDATATINTINPPPVVLKF